MQWGALGEFAQLVIMLNCAPAPTGVPRTPPAPPPAISFERIKDAILSSLLSLVYFIPIVVRGFFSKSSDVVHHGPTTTTNTVAFVGDASGPKVISLFGFQEAPLPCLVAISISCLGCIVLFFSGNVIYNFLLLSLEY